MTGVLMSEPSDTNGILEVLRCREIKYPGQRNMPKAKIKST